MPDRPTLTIDLGILGGTVCITGTRIPAETIGDLVYHGDSVELVAETFALTVDQVLLACAWYVDQRGSRAWASWERQARPIIAGRKPGPCPHPPAGAR